MGLHVDGAMWTTYRYGYELKKYKNCITEDILKRYGFHGEDILWKFEENLVGCLYDYSIVGGIVDIHKVGDGIKVYDDMDKLRMSMVDNEQYKITSIVIQDSIPAILDKCKS